MTSKAELKAIFIIKRDDRTQLFQPKKLTRRLESLRLRPETLDISVKLLVDVISGIITTYPSDEATFTTSDLDDFASRVAITKGIENPLYYNLASRIHISQLHKNTTILFSDVITKLYLKGGEGGENQKICENFYENVKRNSHRLNVAINNDRDYLFDYIGINVLKQCYLFKIDGKIVERPQHLLMRVALAVNGSDIESALEAYEYMSQGYFLHSCQTLLTAGTTKAQFCSSIGLTLEDAKDGVFKCVNQATQISKASIDVAINVHNIPPKGSYVAGMGIKSTGVGPFHRVFNDSLHSIRDSQGHWGNFAFYLEPWHPDIFEFLTLKRNWTSSGSPDLHYAIWIPDLFLERVSQNRTWSLMCPKAAPGLSDVWGNSFDALYEKYENTCRYVRTVSAVSVWEAIITSKILTNSPYILFKDSCNRRSNQQHLGTIRGSSLGTELLQFSSSNEFAVSNSASIAINKCVSGDSGRLDFKKLQSVAEIVTKNLNKSIDVTTHLASGIKTAQLRHRPLAIGVVGLAETLAELCIDFDCIEALAMNQKIFETIYFGAMTASAALAVKEGHYLSFRGSPLSKSLFNFEICDGFLKVVNDWDGIRSSVTQHGVRNSLLIAIKPSDHTSHILGTSDSVEPFLSNLYEVNLFGDRFLMVNPHLAKVLLKGNYWNETLSLELQNAKGSLQSSICIPDDIKAIYKTAWEIEKEVILEMAYVRTPFIDQNQAVNLYIREPDFATINEFSINCWQRDLKSAMYHIVCNSNGVPFKTIYCKRSTPKETACHSQKFNLCDLISSTIT